MSEEAIDLKKIKKFSDLPSDVQKRYREHPATHGMKEDDMLEKFILLRKLANDDNYDEVKILNVYEEDLAPKVNITIQAGKYFPKGNFSKIIKILNIYANPFGNKIFIDVESKKKLFDLVKIFPLVVSISIRNISLHEIPSDLLKGLKFLRGIVITNADLIEIPENLFTHTPYITGITLQNNNIQKISEKMFSNLKFLTTLDLQNNNITSFDENMIPPEQYPHQLEVQLDNNPLPTELISYFRKKYHHQNLTH